MKELNFNDIAQVHGGTCKTCPEFGVDVYLCIDAASAPYVANLIGDFYAGNINSFQQFANAIFNDINAGANFNKIGLEKVQVTQY